MGLVYLLEPDDSCDMLAIVVDQANGQKVDLSGCRLSQVPYPILYSRSKPPT